MTSRTAALASIAGAFAAAVLAIPSFGPVPPPEPPLARLDLNVASVRELDLLPGVGPKTAERIVADRAANGPFRHPGEVRRVKGVTRRAAERISQFTEAR
ncbi:MAG: helix-hairpin-helix domain-containing protein [Planctomycetota bacterium]